MMALVSPRHEFIVTYEGPIHPSSAGVPSASSNRQSLCITLPQTGLDKISNTSYVTQADLLSSISQKIGWPAYLLCIANGIANQQYANDDKLYPTTHTQQQNVILSAWDAVVVFTDSIATITFDSNKTSTENLSSFITGIAGGNLYTASEIRLNE